MTRLDLAGNEMLEKKDKFRKKFLIIVVACVAAGGTNGVALADESDLTTNREIINLGEPLRVYGEALADRGVYFHAYDFNQGHMVTGGGLKHGGVFGGQLDITSIIDLKQAFGVNAGVITATLDAQYGTLARIGSHYTGASLIGSGIGGPGTVDEENTYRLAELTYGQTFLSEKLWLLVGRSQPTWLFNLRNYGLGFESSNIVFGSPLTIFNNGAGDYPTSHWGGLFRIMPNDNFYYQAGVWESANLTDPNKHNLSFGLQHAHGVYIPMEMGVATELNGKPGRYSIGGFYDTGNVARPDGQVDKSDHSALYVHGKQTFWKPSNGSSRGLSVFAQASWATDGNYNYLDSAYTLGFLSRGPFAWRPTDSAGIAMTYEKLSPETVDIRDGNATGSTHNLKDYELALELYYDADVGSGISLRPFIQYIKYPDQVLAKRVSSHNTSATVIGINLSIDLGAALGMPKFDQVVFRP